MEDLNKWKTLTQQIQKIVSLVLDAYSLYQELDADNIPEEQLREWQSIVNNISTSDVNRAIDYFYNMGEFFG
jgi:hypothetical protein